MDGCYCYRQKQQNGFEYLPQWWIILNNTVFRGIGIILTNTRAKLLAYSSQLINISAAEIKASSYCRVLDQNPPLRSSVDLWNRSRKNFLHISFPHIVFLSGGQINLLSKEPALIRTRDLTHKSESLATTIILKRSSRQFITNITNIQKIKTNIPHKIINKLKLNFKENSFEFKLIFSFKF